MAKTKLTRLIAGVSIRWIVIGKGEWGQEKEFTRKNTIDNVWSEKDDHLALTDDTVRSPFQESSWENKTYTAYFIMDDPTG